MTAGAKMKPSQQSDVTGMSQRISEISQEMSESKLPTLETHRQRLILKLVYKSIKKLSPPILWDLFTTTVPRYNLRNRRDLVSSHCRTKTFGKRSLKEHGTMLWNSLPPHARDLDLESFNKYLEEWQESGCKCNKCRFTN